MIANETFTHHTSKDKEEKKKLRNPYYTYKSPRITKCGTTQTLLYSKKKKPTTHLINVMMDSVPINLAAVATLGSVMLNLCYPD